MIGTGLSLLLLVGIVTTGGYRRTNPIQSRVQDRSQASAAAPEAAVLTPSAAPATPLQHIPVLPPPPAAPTSYPFGAAPEEKRLTNAITVIDPPRLAYELTADQRRHYESRVIMGTDENRKYHAVRVEELWTRGANPRLVSRHAMVGDHLIVSSSAGPARLRAALPAGFAIRRSLHSPGAVLVSFPVESADSLPSARMALQKLGPALVKHPDPDTFVQAASVPNDPLFSDQWALHNTGQNGGTPDADIDAPEAWDLRTGATAFPIAVIDTGIDYTHPDLDANIWTNPGETGTDSKGRDKSTNGVDDDNNGYEDDWRGWDFANNDNNPMDDHGHGTHIAGIIGAEGHNGEGIAGVCWSCRLMPLKVLTTTGGGAWSDVIDAVAYAKAMGARVGNLSFGAYGAAPEEAKSAFAAASETLWCAAAGNGELPHNGNQTGDDLDEFHFFPACLDIGNMVSVAATARDDTPALFSNYGRFMADLAAPGVSIVSAAAGGGYAVNSGTSMACALVSGIAALSYDAWNDPPPLQMRRLLQQTVNRKEAFAGKWATKGRLNAERNAYMGTRRYSWSQLSSSQFRPIQLLPDGTVVRWGFEHSTTPQKLPQLSEIVSIRGGGNAGYALRENGTLWSWGDGTSGTGRPPGENTMIPGPIPNLNDVVQFATPLNDPNSGLSHYWALTKQGAVYEWVISSLVMPGVPGRSPYPELIAGLPPIKKLIPGNAHCFALAENDEVWVWGERTGITLQPLQAGENYYMPPTLRSELSPVADIQVIANHAGGVQNYFLKSDGSVLGYGYGYLGNGTSNRTTPPVVTPQLLPGWAGTRAFGLSEYNVFGVQRNGTVKYCGGMGWEYNGNDWISQTETLEPVVIDGLHNVGFCNGYGLVVMGYRRDGTGFRWPEQGTVDIVPEEFPSLRDAVEFRPHQMSSFLTVSGTSYNVGANTGGALGLGVLPDKTRPVEVPALKGATGIFAGESASAASLPDGNLYYWGHAGSIGPLKAGLAPVANVKKALCMNQYSEFVLTADGTPYFIDRTIGNPVHPLTGIANVVDIAGNRVRPKPMVGQAGQVDLLILLCLKSDGSVWERILSWNELRLQAGQDLTPVRVEGLPAIKAVEITGGQRYAVTENGDVWQWGTFAQPGENSVPSLIQGVPGIQQLSAHGELAWATGGTISHVVALTLDQSVVEWKFRLDSATSGTIVTSPAFVAGLSGVTAVAAGKGHALAIKADQSLWAWGLNASGCLGVGDTADHGLVRVYGLGSVVEVTAGSWFSLARLSDGSVWCWGYGDVGNLPDGAGYATEPVPSLAYSYSTTVFNTGNGFSDWLTTYFNEQDLRDIELSGDEKDPDRDGLTNILEYALGTHPRKQTIPVADTSVPVPPPTATAEFTGYLPMAKLEKVRRNYYSNGVGLAGAGAADEERSHLVMTVPRAERRSDVDYIVEVSDDMEEWHHGPGYTVEVVNTLTNLVVYDAEPWEESRRRFIRLKLVRNNPGQSSIPR